MTDEEPIIKYCKIRNVKSPTRAHIFDAGIDFYVPEDLTLDTMKPKFDISSCYPLTQHDNKDGTIKSFSLKPGQSVLIPSGIKVKVPNGYMLQYHNKSGIASKRGLVVAANTVDIGYEGECHLNLYNVSDRIATINAGDKICQGILVRIGFHRPIEVQNEEKLYGPDSERSVRGEGGFGSTGTK